MASGKDTFKRFLSDDKILGGLWNSIAGPSTEEEAAARDRAQAQQLANDQLGFTKATAAQNNATVDAADRAIFGGPPEASAGAFDPFHPPVPTQQAPAAPGGPAHGIPASGLPDGANAVDPGGNPYWDAGIAAQASAAQANMPSAPETASGGQTRRLLRNPAVQGAKAPPPDTSTLPGALKAAFGYQSNATDQYRNDLAGIQNPGDTNYVGDVHSQAGDVTANPQDVANQQRNLSRLEGLTGVKETAEEKLMREVARRNMEGQMKGDRDAMAQRLQARGVYGSGAEIASQLSGQQGLASSRALEELAAQANAQKRAMAAIGQYSDLSTKMRDEGFNEKETAGKAADVTSMFNNGVKQQNEQFNTKQKADNNRATAQRLASGMDAATNLANSARGDAGTLTNTRLALTGLKTGTATGGANLVNNASSNLANSFKQDAVFQDAKDQTGQGFGPL